MTTVRSYLQGEWHEAQAGWVSLIDPCSEEPIARASTAGVDFYAAKHNRGRDRHGQRRQFGSTSERL